MGKETKKKFKILLDEKTSIIVEAEDFEVNYEINKIVFYNTSYNELQRTKVYHNVAVFNFGNIKGFTRLNESECENDG